ncbi:MAG: hypothetical protein LUI85_01185 [Bacteroides sp.]|nr:hypothetical protein [Bacteroides sp.]
MRNKVLIFIVLSSLCSIFTTVTGQTANKEKPYTGKDATIAIDAFHQTFYNPEMKLYAISSDGKGRAAIWVQAITGT